MNSFLFNRKVCLIFNNFTGFARACRENSVYQKLRFSTVSNWLKILHTKPCTGSLNTGWAKSQFTYVGTVTECSFEIILSGMTYYHHWFKEFVESKHIFVHFFQMKVHFCIYLIVWIVGSSQI